MTSSHALLLAGILLGLFCVVPLFWGLLSRTDSTAVRRLRAHPRLLIAGTLCAWSVTLAARALDSPWLGLLASAALVVLAFGVIILLGEQLAQRE